MAIKRKRRATKRKVSTRSARPKGRVAASKRTARPGKRPMVRKPRVASGGPAGRPGGGKRP